MFSIVEILFVVVFLSISAIYMLLMTILAYNLKTNNTQTEQKIDLPVDIIIAYRNEAENIRSCLESLVSQSHKNCQFIVVNDHSTDNSFQIVKKFTQDDCRFTSLQLPQNKQGKKYAQLFGLDHSKGDIVLFTDADCLLSSQWTETMIRSMVANKTALCSGTLLILSHGSFFETLQAVETLFLTGVGHALIAIGKPVLCNGASLAMLNHLSKSDVQEEISSGDDIFRLQDAVKKNQKICFSNSPQGFVYTKAQPTIIEWFKQRIRWIGKAKHYNDRFASLFTVFIGLVQLTAITSLFTTPLRYAALIWAVKLLGETIFISKAMHIYKQRFSLVHILTVGILYPAVSLIAGILSLVVKPKWKGRTIDV